ncbi:hypothetical protein SLE2022_391450 [Rubroshorea leprosula]
MSTSHHPSDMDSAAGTFNSSPRSDHDPFHDFQGRVRVMCSFGGKIVPRPHDNQLRYVGGDTRIVALNRSITFSGFLSKLSKLSGISNVNVKYQLPNEDLDALISVTTEEDLENMMDECDRLAQNQNPRSARLRLFLFSKGDDSRTSSISSLLDGSTNREHWFFDALNSGGAGSGSGLVRVRSEVSSIVSEVPDYLFGLDNSDESQPREPTAKTRPVLNENVSVSDPGSPAAVVSSPFCSTSSAPIVPTTPDLPPVKTKPDNQDPVMDSKLTQTQTGEFVERPVTTQPTGYTGNPTWHYVPDTHYSGPSPTLPQIPVYYVPGPVPPGTAPVQPVQFQAQHIPQYTVPVPGQVPIGYSQPVPGVGQVYRPAVATMDPYDTAAMRVVLDAGQQQVYYGVRNASPVPVYPGMVVPGGEEFVRDGLDATPGRISQSGSKFQ